MKVLGLSPLDKDSTVTLMEDGKITFAAGEERFSRVKLQDGFPWRALQAALDTTGTSAGDLDVVSYPFLAWDEETQLFRRNLENERTYLEESDSAPGTLIADALTRVPNRTFKIPGLQDVNERMAKGFAKSVAYKLLANEGLVSRNVAKRGSDEWGRSAEAFHRKWHDELLSALTELGIVSKLKRVDHHTSHAANAYYTSGFTDALIVTLDGYGSGLAGSISTGRDGRIERIHGIEYPHSLGTFYESVTSALGFKPSRHEGKIVGLAAYGDPAVLSEVLLARFDRSPGDFRIRESNNVFFSRMLATQFPKIDVAAAYQFVLEKVACDYVEHYVKQTGLKNLVLSGGVVANVKLNQRLRALPGVERIFIHPNMGDGGCGTGAALLEFVGREELKQPIHDVYLGPSYSDDEIAAALQRAQLPSTRYNPIEAEDRGADCGREGSGALRRQDGIRPTGVGQPLDSLPCPRARGESVAEPAAWADGVHAVCAGYSDGVPTRLLQHDRRVRTRVGIHDVDLRLHARDEGNLPRGGPHRWDRPPAAGVIDVEPRLSPDSHRVSRAHRHSVAHQHQLQHARGTHRLFPR